LTGRQRLHPLAWLERQLRVISFALYVGTIALFVAFGLAGCASTPALRAAGIAVGAAIVAGAIAERHHDDAPRPDVPAPSNPCIPKPEHCK
jgi:hypothetical protein